MFVKFTHLKIVTSMTSSALTVRVVQVTLTVLRPPLSTADTS